MLERNDVEERDMYKKNDWKGGGEREIESKEKREMEQFIVVKIFISSLWEILEEEKREKSVRERNKENYKEKEENNEG